MLALSSDLVHVRELAKQLPGRPHVSTLHRWISSGLRGHRLEAVKIGASFYSNTDALERFIAELNPTSPKPPKVVSEKRTREKAAAKARLAAKGV